jgi:hypothetical protein
MSIAVLPGYDDWKMDYYPQHGYCPQCSALIEGSSRSKEEHKEWCPEHPGYSVRAERIVRDVIAMHFYDMHFKPEDVAIVTTRHDNGEITARVECCFKYLQIEEAA